jgi:GNAT superfamily N-acetyltransferase
LVAFPGNDEVGRAGVEYWHWQYREPPAGFARTRVAVAGDRIVGHYAVIPVAMQVQGKPVCGTLSLDTMTHPDYQRQGILTTLAGEVYQELGRDDLPLTYGFPNENSVGALTKVLGWDYLCALPVYVKPLRPDAIAEAVLPSRTVAAVAKPLARLGTALVSRPSPRAPEAAAHIRRLEQFDTRADGLWQTAYDPSTNALTRSARFLNWRYPRNPLRAYHILAYEEEGQLIAYAVLRCMNQFGLRGGMITDLVGRPGRQDALQGLLAAAEVYFQDQGMDLIACLMHGDRDTVRVLKRAGFLTAPRRTFKQWHFCVRLNNESVDRKAAVDPNRWYVTFGDTDII